MAPAWIMDIFAAVMLTVAAVSAARLVPGSPWRGTAGDADVDVDAAHLLMGISMAGMLAGGLKTLPGGAWEVVFAVLAAWFAWRVLGEAHRQGARVLTDGHRVPHLVHSTAMVYMFAAPVTMAGGNGQGASGMGMGGATGAAPHALRLPVLALVFALWLSLYVVLDLDRLSGPGGHPHGSYFAPMPAVPAPAAVADTSATVPVPAAAVSLPAADGRGGDARRALLVSRQLAAGCRIAMGVTMAFMLVTMI